MPRLEEPLDAPRVEGIVPPSALLEVRADDQPVRARELADVLRGDSGPDENRETGDGLGDAADVVDGGLDAGGSAGLSLTLLSALTERS